MAAATIGVIYGYDTGNISGAQLFITNQFHLDTSTQETLTTSLSIGLIVGALIAGRLANAIGRRTTLLVVAGGYAVFAVASGLAPNLLWLDISRFLLGVAIGLSIVAAPIFIAESAPAAIRGGLIVTYQVATVTGIMLAYFIDFGLSGSGQWRLMLALSAIPSALVFLLFLRLPDTARWYLMRGRREQARATLARTDPRADLDHEIAEIQRSLISQRGSAREMIRRPYASATLFVVTLGFLVQITGINAITYYSPLIFQQMGFTGNFSLLVLPGIIEAASLAATIVSVLIIDRIGRRVTLLTGIGTMVAANVLMVALFSAGNFSGIKSDLGFVGILSFTMAFNFGFGALVWVYASESFPARLRGAGASAMLVADLVANLIVAQFFLSALRSLGGTMTFAIFLGLAMFAWVFVFWLAPETKGRPLESIRHYWENGRRWPDATVKPATPAGEMPRLVDGRLADGGIDGGGIDGGQLGGNQLGENRPDLGFGDGTIRPS